MNKVQINWGWWLVGILTIMTVFLWTLSGEWLYRFDSFLSTMTSIGKICGLLGTLYFSISTILSVRIKLWERMFVSMDRVYWAHHMIGGLSFVLLMIHPLTLALAYVPTSINYAAKFLLPPLSDYPVYFGSGSLLTMMLFLILTFFVRLPYQVWKFTHKFMGLALFLGAIHSFFIPSDMYAFVPLRIFMLSMIGIGIGFYIYWTILGSILVKKYRYIVDKVVDMGGDVFGIVMKPIDKKLIFEAGQFIFVNFIQKGFSKETHPFSIASGSNEEKIIITVKKLGDYTNSLHLLLPGTIAKIEGPYGKFGQINYQNNHQIWVAGGIGIAPFLSMVKELQKIKNEVKVDLFYCVKDKSEIVGGDLFEEKESELNNFRFFPFYTNKYGYLDAKLIGDMSGEIIGREIYLCGPIPMMKNFRRQFKSLGVPNKNIHSEEFQIK